MKSIIYIYIFIFLVDEHSLRASCEDIVFAPSYERLVNNFSASVKSINLGQNCSTNLKVCEPNNTGTCFANGAVEAYAKYDYAAHPIHVALLYTKKYESNIKDAKFSSGEMCLAMKMLKDEAKICDQEKFNKKFGLNANHPFDEILDYFILPAHEISTDSILVALVKNLLYLNDLDAKDKMILDFKNTLSKDTLDRPFDRLKLSDFAKKLSDGTNMNIFNFIWEKNRWLRLSSQIKDLVKAKGKNLKLIDLQFTFMNSLCIEAGVMKENPIYGADIDYIYNFIGDEAGESKKIQKYLDLKKATPIGARYPDHINIDLNKFIDPTNAPSSGGHSFMVLGQRWDATSKRCHLVMKDTNPHYDSQYCKSAPDRQLEAIYDKKTFSCFYYFPKYELINSKNKYMKHYCFIANSKEIIKVKNQETKKP